MSARFTARVRRGLGVALRLMTDSLDPDKAPGFTAAARLDRAERSDLEGALDWLAENAGAPEPGAPHLVGRARALLDIAGGKA